MTTFSGGLVVPATVTQALIGTDVLNKNVIVSPGSVTLLAAKAKITRGMLVVTGSSSPAPSTSQSFWS